MILSRVWAYEKREPSPEPAYTNNDEKSYESLSPDIFQPDEPSPEKCEKCREYFLFILMKIAMRRH